MAIDKKQCGPRKFGTTILSLSQQFPSPTTDDVICPADAGRMTLIISVRTLNYFFVGPARLYDAIGNAPFPVNGKDNAIFEYDKWGPIIQEEWRYTQVSGPDSFTVSQVYWNS